MATSSSLSKYKRASPKKRTIKIPLSMADLSKRLGYEVVDLVLSDPFCWQIGQDYAFSSFWIFPRHRICYEKVSVEHMMLKPMAG